MANITVVIVQPLQRVELSQAAWRAVEMATSRLESKENPSAERGGWVPTDRLASPSLDLRTDDVSSSERLWRAPSLQAVGYRSSGLFRRLGGEAPWRSLAFLGCP
jgi:hypothetical protein